MKLIRRQKYENRIVPFIGKSLIKVLIGQRRVGKSYLLLQLLTLFKKINPGANIIKINKEDEAFDAITNQKELTQYIQSKLSQKKGVQNFILIDEIQEIESFENSLRSFYSKPNIDIYITGSNSEILSGELAGRLSGRYIEIPVYSLDYTEFLKFHSLKSGVENTGVFLKYGGMPFLRNLELKDEIIFEYLKNVYSTILYKDIISRYDIRNVNFLDRLINFTADNVGNILTAKKISDYLKSQKINISVNSVLDYLSFLVKGQILLPVKRYDIKGKRHFEIGEKYYFQDLGLRNAISGFKPGDMGQLMENCVLQHLVSHGYEVFTGDWNKKEIDFIAIKNNERTYIQVTYLLHDSSTITREFGNLLAIEDNYRKMVISMDADYLNTYKGIEHQNLESFLMGFE